MCAVSRICKHGKPMKFIELPDEMGGSDWECDTDHCPQCGATDPALGENCEVCVVALNEMVRRAENAAGWDPNP